MEAKTNNFNVLEAMRGVAALMVVFFHMNSHWGGYLAVDFFLVLSGFILTHTYHAPNNTTSKRNFILKRIIRLYPLHIFSLLILIIVHITINQSLPSVKDNYSWSLFQQLTMTQNVGLSQSGLTWNWPSWSISVEFWVNVLFILFITRTTKSIPIFVTSFLCLAIIFINSSHLNVHYQNFYTVINAGLLRGIGSFCLGILAYRLYIKMSTSSYKNHLIRYAGWYETVLVILLACLLFIRDDSKSSLDFFAPPLFFLMVALFALEAGYLSRGLKEIRYLGTISYSIYLNQIAVLMACEYIFNTYSLNQNHLMTVVILTLIAYSHLTYRYIENPSKRFLQRKLGLLHEQ